jgi:hypothetical protein
MADICDLEFVNSEIRKIGTPLWQEKPSVGGITDGPDSLMGPLLSWAHQLRVDLSIKDRRRK